MHDRSFPERVRDSFLVFQRTLNGRSFALFDGPGGTQVPRAVGAAVAGYLTLHNANSGGAFATSIETDATIALARARMAEFLNAPAPREVAFGANMTTLTYHLSRALAREWGEGDEVVVTELDHQANVAPWRQAADEAGATVRTVPFHRETCTLDFDALERAVSPRTRLVAVGAASNAVGTVTDVARAARIAHEAGALCFVDAVHFAPHRLLDVQAIGCDFLACSAYKFFGPHVGALWGREEHLRRLTPYKVPPASDAVPNRWETGTLNHEGIAGAGAAVEWIAALAGDEVPPPPAPLRPTIERGMAALHAHEMETFTRLWDGLGDIRGVRRYGLPADGDRTPTAAFTVAGVHADAVAARLAAEAVFVWSGDFYAPTVIERLGLADVGGVIRAGVAPYTTADDVDRLLAGVERIAGGASA
jgi:cysteine desulfurase family protein (TIGR01976 family)